MSWRSPIEGASGEIGRSYELGMSDGLLRAEGGTVGGNGSKVGENK